MGRYKNSEEMLERALKTIPLGSQTFSKSITQFPLGVSPYFIERGKGSKVWDIDGNEYVDFISGLLSVSIGYANEEINNAVKKQLDRGVSFSLSNTLEAEVSEKLVEMIPCAEMVRFGKNGTDATSAAVRLSRAHTGKEIILVCGYHGWQDWYIGSTTRSLGVPNSTRDLTKTFTYNDLDSFNRAIADNEGNIAAVIMEPMNIAYPNPGFLEHIRTVTAEKNIVMIFDETITGCRFARGGAQELFGVTPDLATFGKGIGNGFPLSAVVGKVKIMKLMEDIFYSGTFAGETVSLTATKVALDIIDREDVPSYLSEIGTYLIDSVKNLIAKYNVEHFVSIDGHPSWSFLMFKDIGTITSFHIKTYFMQEMFKRGILSFGTHNLSFSHSRIDIDKLILAYDEFFDLLCNAIKNNSLLDSLNCKSLEPIFKVR
jgi:glutamate-1-semialdehyde 2,1-aminomutase